MAAKDDIILGIESSCDDTSAAILKNGEILSNIVAGQKVHEEFGGVVPELASRAHQQNIVPVVDTAIKKAGISKEDLSGIAFTRGPGLLGSLLVGVSFAKSLGLALDIPLIEVDHMKAHILAHFIKRDGYTAPKFPFICLTVSGGHTQIVLIRDYYDMEILGQTKDDAAGEAFDKAAKLMNLPYPGGPLIDKYAKSGDPKKYEFPISNVPNYDFSFSGLKTALLYFLQDEIKKDADFVQNNLADICASYQHTIIKTLFKKLIKACKAHQITEVAIAGGVSANSLLRSELERIGNEMGWQTYIPPFEFCTDNGAMIAIAGYYKYISGSFTDQSVVPLARLKF
ncbi:MAG: tRNA (adenosine(37)-N6)-threonylcarbamoyltransferase complex transferase subunit TsaD [Crocinitomicaceae bacterium]|nr:tRNA (adenosine(37)-N6)-threonylcarbamoyltransferase complex transferase subunit TsaD [Crocinitomicaceae bacterium]